jgi:hypothetical protein
MTLVMACLFVTIVVFGCICLRLSAKLHDANVRIEILEVKATYSEQSEKTLRESVDLQTKCIRNLNDIVKKSVEGKEPAKPDTKALISGWDVDEAEPEDPVKNHIVDICLNGTPEQKQYLINTMTLQNILLGQTQQCIYPWSPLQTGLLSQTQQCIYPWQPWQPLQAGTGVTYRQ